MRDRRRSKILKTSAFGLIEMTRQRTRQSLKRSVYQDCPHCHGMAQVKTCESMSLEVVRLLQLAACRERGAEHRGARGAGRGGLPAQQEAPRDRQARGGRRARFTSRECPGRRRNCWSFQCLDKNNNEVRVLPQEAPPPMRHRR